MLNEEELQNSIMKAVLRMKTREDYESKLGDVIYTFAGIKINSFITIIGM